MNRESGANLDVKVHIHSFPFLGRLLVRGEVSQVRASAVDVQEGQVTLHHLELDIHDVVIDRSRMLTSQRLYLRGTGRGSASADLTADALSNALGTPVQVVDGAVEITVAGQRVRADVATDQGMLALKVAGLTLPSFTIPTGGLLPCHPKATFAGDRIPLACTVTAVPARLVNMVNGATARTSS